MSKYLEKVRQAEDEIAAEVVEDAFADYNAEERQMAAILLGRAQATDSIAVALSAEVIRFLAYFEETKSYRALGHPDFVTFLANSGLHGVTKHKYYDRKKVLDLEGDPVYDALSLAGIPVSLRKQLEPGDVTVDGNNIIVKAESDDDDIIIDKDNHIAIVQTLRSLATARRQDRLQIEAVREKLDAVEAKHDAEKRELYDDLDRIKASKLSEVAATPHMNARVELGIAFRKLTETAANLSPIEKDQFRDGVFEDIAGWRTDLAAAYKTDTKRAPVETTLGPDDTLETGFDKFFEDNKLADLL